MRPPSIRLPAPAASLLLAGFYAATGLAAGCRTHTPGRAAVATRPVTAPTGDPLAPRSTIAEADLARFAGSEACVSCHPGQAGQLKTHHARTLAAARADSFGTLFRRPGTVEDRRTGVRFRPAVDGTDCVIEAKQGASVERTRAEYAFGSGNRCFTFVGAFAGSPAELRISYYRQAGRWDFTPGQQPERGSTTPVGRAITNGEKRACVLCHSTAVVEENGVLSLERSVLGIGCETCHGPGREHIAAVQEHQTDLKIARLSDRKAELTTKLCGQCHRTSESGDPHDPEAAGQLPRIQGLALSRSACYLNSGGRLSCVTCHDPHRDATATTRTDYNRACISCHTPHTAGQLSCPKAPAGDCVNCHMPSQAVKMPTKPRFRTHWIKVWTGKATTASKRARAG